MKTTLRRQVALIFCLLLVALIFIGVLFMTFFNRAVTEKQESSLYTTAEAVCELLEAYASSYVDLWEFRTHLNVAAVASENDVLICSPSGVAQVCARAIQDCEHIGTTLGSDTAEQIFSQGGMAVRQQVSRIYGEDRLAVALPVVDQDNQPLCIVVASTQSAVTGGMLTAALRIFLTVAVLVLLMALLATPFLTRRETRPIQNMAAAARQIAHGNLNVRVPTGNRNEEIEELAVAFNNMAGALRNSDTVRQEFVANVSHELKTPMTTIAGYLDGMLDGTIPQERHRYYMELVSTEVRRLSRLVRSMLDVSRLGDQGVDPEKLTDFDICETAGQTLLSFEQRINQKHLNVEVDLPEYGLQIRALQDGVTQVVYNLLDNAVKFVDEGGTLGIRVEQKSGKAWVSIANTGPTISPEELPLIFDRFHKTDKSRSTDRDGVGLGLYIVKAMVMAHGEDIFVTSHDGRTEFTFTMPLSR